MKNNWLRLALGVGLVLALAALARTEDKPPAVKPLAADASLDDILDALDVRGQTLQDFSAKVVWKKTETALNSSTTWIGTLYYQNQPGKNGRLHVQFDTHIVGKTTHTNNGKTMLEYLLDGNWLTTRDYQRTSQLRQQVAKPGQKINLFKLGEGAFPLPIGQDKKDVHAQFDVTIVPADKADPPGTVHLQLKPKPDSSLARKFKTIDTWIELKSSMPVVIQTLDPNEAQLDRTQLGEVQTQYGVEGQGF